MRKFILAACVLAIAAVQGFAQSEIIKVEDAPTAVSDAAEKAAPGVEFTAARKVTEKKGDVEVINYELIGKEKKGKKRSVAFLCREDGRGGFVLVEVALEKVPTEVTDALKDAHPTFEASVAREAGLSTRNITHYCVLGKIGDDQVAFLVSADGKQVVKLN